MFMDKREILDTPEMSALSKYINMKDVYWTAAKDALEAQDLIALDEIVQSMKYAQQLDPEILAPQPEMLEVGTRIGYESEGELRLGTITAQGYKNYGVDWDDGKSGQIPMTDVFPV
jgi:hypothetical protein